MDCSIEDIKKLIQTARQKEIAADKAMQNVMNTINTLIPNIDEISSEAENAENLDEAISCYIQYGEFGIKNLMKEIEEALNK